MPSSLRHAHQTHRQQHQSLLSLPETENLSVGTGGDLSSLNLLSSVGGGGGTQTAGASAATTPSGRQYQNIQNMNSAFGQSNRGPQVVPPQRNNFFGNGNGNNGESSNANPTLSGNAVSSSSSSNGVNNVRTGNTGPDSGVSSSNGGPTPAAVVSVRRPASASGGWRPTVRNLAEASQKNKSQNRRVLNSVNSASSSSSKNQTVPAAAAAGVGSSSSSSSTTGQPPPPQHTTVRVNRDHHMHIQFAMFWMFTNDFAFEIIPETRNHC